MPNKYSDDELRSMVKSTGWKDEHGTSGTLEDVLKASHRRRQSGEKPSLIRQIENEVELDMLQIEKLWRYLGLPV
ncbi:MAG TPA: hypothetical protein VG891_04885 [Rhizomicrobium sp.]|jgi:hypothetical protein|nr:hypothetical protein [Rhizomicrobium sp.]